MTYRGLAKLQPAATTTVLPPRTAILRSNHRDSISQRTYIKSEGAGRLLVQGRSHGATSLSTSYMILSWSPHRSCELSESMNQSSGLCVLLASYDTRELCKIKAGGACMPACLRTGSFPFSGSRQTPTPTLTPTATATPYALRSQCLSCHPRSAG